jgi:hypothetical protein
MNVRFAASEFFNVLADNDLPIRPGANPNHFAAR